MSKPHEETWEAIFPYADPDGGVWEVVIEGTETLRADVVFEHDARLMAQAPAMARLLLRLQWAGRAGPAGDVDGGCPACERERPDEHAPDCELVAVLRAAGVLA